MGAQGPGGQPVRLPGVGPPGRPGTALVQPRGCDHPAQPDGHRDRLPAPWTDRARPAGAVQQLCILALPRRAGLCRAPGGRARARRGAVLQIRGRGQGADLAAGIPAPRGRGQPASGAGGTPVLVRTRTIVWRARHGQLFRACHVPGTVEPDGDHRQDRATRPASPTRVSAAPAPSRGCGDPERDGEREAARRFRPARRDGTGHGAIRCAGDPGRMPPSDL